MIPKDKFVGLMKSATSSDDFMYKQTDGVAMRSPLGPALAHIFVGYYEEKLFSQMQKPPNTSDMLITCLPSSITKLKQMNF